MRVKSMQVVRSYLLAMLCCVSALAALAQDASYEVRLALDPGDDPPAVARQLAATYRVRLESHEPSSVLVVSASEASARLLATDRRVTLVQPVPVAMNATGFGTYEYDGSGNIITAGADTFVYDKVGRIHRATISGIEQTFTYDSHGNITRIATKGESGGDIAVGTGNKLSAATYDGSGNLVSYHAGTFVYDGLNVITESTPAGGNRHLYIYTASNERLATIELLPGGLQQSEWTLRDPNGRVLRRLARDTSGRWSWKEDYIYRGSQLLAAEVPTPEKVRHFHLDHLGTPRLITGNGGANVAERAYGAFGRGFALSPSDVHEVLEFTGHERDNFQLDYMHARYYDPMWGRFLSADPGRDWDLRQPQSWNMYSYVRNNPINNTDPEGKWCIPCLAPLVPVAMRAAPAVVRGGQRAYIYLSNPTNVQRMIRTGRSIVGAGVALAEGIYEFPDEKAPGKTYVGQSEDTDRRLSEHEGSGKKDPEKDAKVVEVKGGKTAREHAEQNRINELGGKSSMPGSQTSNKVNPIGPKRQPAVEEVYGPIKPPRPRVVPEK
ncbi:MAG TPA: RHS repeat-associated core domain-containing protein [Thermoanaerobaculia bacterium]|nr:RHS repeat-associated core domain-containing protein [Thermoanaerobaculia bacterium]